MSRILRCRLLAFLCLLLPLCLFAATDSLSVAERNAQQGFNDTIDRLAPDFVQVSLCVADPTDPQDDYTGVAGHAFLRLQCPTFDLDYCYSYESATVKGNIIKLLRGELSMSMLAINTDTYLRDYRVWKRAVHEYRINMPPDAELRLWEQMDNHLVTEREMPIDMIKFGCAHTVLFYIEKALFPDTISYNWPKRFYEESVLEIVGSYYSNYPWIFLAQRITTNIDEEAFTSPKQKVILPADLLEVWLNATINGKPVLEYVGDLVEAEPVIMERPWFTPKVCGILLLILIVAGIGIAIILKHRK